MYTGKAVAGLIDLIRKGNFNKEDNILFVHSGGSPALYANTSLLRKCKKHWVSNAFCYILELLRGRRMI